MLPSNVDSACYAREGCIHIGDMEQFECNVGLVIIYFTSCTENYYTLSLQKEFVVISYLQLKRWYSFVINWSN